MFYATSSYSITASLRRAMGLLQANLTRAQKEVATGRHADLGVALGQRARYSFTLAAARESIDATNASNQLVSARLDTTQVALSALLSDARDFRSTLVAAQTDGGQPEAIATRARQALSTFISKLNSVNGDGYLFGGVSTDRPPIANYFADPPSENKSALDAAFLAEFGFSQSDQAVASIEPAEMQSFLDGAFQGLFDDANWQSGWSRGSDKPIRSRIGLSVTMESSVTANEPALRKLAAAYAMVGDLAADKLGKQTYLTVLRSAVDTVDRGIEMLTKTQARVGVMLNSVKTADNMMAIQSSLIQTQLYDLESVDPAEASARVSGLMTQMETAYTLTAKISQLSLTKYL